MLRFAAGAERLLLQLPTVDDAVLQGDRELELRFDTDNPGLQLPTAPVRLLLQDDEAPALLLTSRWINDRELELIYDPSAARSGGTGLELSLSDPTGGGLFAAARLSDVFLSGWVGETLEGGTLQLRWSDPLAAAWPGPSANVRLARLQFDRPAASSSPEIRIVGRAGEEQLLRWIDSPWQAPRIQPLQEQLGVIVAEGGAPVQIEGALAAALAITANGDLRILDARALLERRYGLNPSLGIRRNGELIQLDLMALMPGDGAALQLSQQEWSLLPVEARDGTPAQKASQSLLLRSQQGSSLSEISFNPFTGEALAAAEQLAPDRQPLFGQLGFSLDGITPGSLQRLELSLPEGGVFNPLLLKQDASGAWEPFDYDPITGTGAQFHDDNGNGRADRAVLWIRDGGRGDRDGLVNGRIVDPALIAGSLESTPPPPQPLPELSIAASSAVKEEGISGSTVFTFTVTRSGDLTGVSSASWSVVGTGANPAEATDFDGAVLP